MAALAEVVVVQQLTVAEPPEQEHLAKDMQVAPRAAATMVVVAVAQQVLVQAAAVDPTVVTAEYFLS
jgi:hypothetical protein